MCAKKSGACTPQTGKQRKLLGPSNTALFQPVSNRGRIPANHIAGGGNEGKTGSVNLSVIALEMSACEFKGRGF